VIKKKNGLAANTRGDEGLFHFQWPNRISNVVEVDQIVFPDEVVFEKVQETPERVYIFEIQGGCSQIIFLDAGS
jgi:26S proteasome regulatory subunit N13